MRYRPGWPSRALAPRQRVHGLVHRHSRTDGLAGARVQHEQPVAEPLDHRATSAFGHIGEGPIVQPTDLLGAHLAERDAQIGRANNVAHQNRCGLRRHHPAVQVKTSPTLPMHYEGRRREISSPVDCGRFSSWLRQIAGLVNGR